jgi:superfamily II DNA or RNA helicase
MSRSRHIPEAVRRRVEFFSGQECAECGRTIDGEALLRHLDHRDAFAEGGEHVVFNIDPLCHACNQAKGAGSTPRTERLGALREKRAEEIRRYFQETDANIVANDCLREPQANGYLALRDYFAGDDPVNLPAIAVLPTGCGKSGLIACAPFGIAEGRVLAVTPNLTIKEGLAEGALTGPDSFYDFCDVLPPGVPRPKVVALERGRVNEEDCLRADVVVTNVQQMQGWIPLFPRDFFDMIVVDEAHHAPADSWQNVNEAFPDAKKVYLTATPFRGDGRPIRAEPVYTYRLADAIAAGYVKNIVRVDAVAAEMTFTMEDEETSFTREEIMDLREETWFSRGVALSQVCNETIVDRSIRLLREKQRRGDERHQIIAAACSIRHAERVATLYRERGLRASYVASEGMTMEERERRIREYDDGRIDAMVHVGILGEGYDNPNISVAAIFRPFRSTSPYTQFVGRAIRALPEGNEIDNRAHVVAHAGLNQEALWDYFKHEVEEAQVLADIHAWDNERGEAPGGDEDAGGAGADAAEGESDAGTSGPKEPPEVTRETIEGVDVDAYLPVEGEAAAAAQEQLERMEEALEGLRDQGLDVPDAEQLKRRIAAMNAPDGADAPHAGRPDRERNAYRKVLDQAVRRAAGRIVHRLGIPRGDDLVGVVGKGGEDSNFEVVVRMVNRAVNRAMGKEPSAGDGGRNAWLRDELKAAEAHVGDARETVQDAIEAATDYAPGGEGPGRGRSSRGGPEGTGSHDGPAGEGANEAPSGSGGQGGDETWGDLDDFDWGQPFER